MAKINGVGPDAEMTTHKNGGMETIPIGRFDLLPPRATIKIAALFMEKSTTIKGPRKYPKNNWRLLPCRKHLNHAVGHIFAFFAGDTSDDHLTHAASRLMMAMEVKDDRPYDKVGRKK